MMKKLLWIFLLTIVFLPGLRMATQISFGEGIISANESDANSKEKENIYQVVSGVVVKSQCDLSDLEDQEKQLLAKIDYHNLSTDVGSNVQIEDEVMFNKPDIDYSLIPISKEKEDRVMGVNTPAPVDHFENPNILKEQLIGIRQTKKQLRKTNDLLAQLVASQLTTWTSYLSKLSGLVIVVTVRDFSRNWDSLAVYIQPGTYVSEVVYKIFESDEQIYTGYYIQPNNRGNSLAYFKADEKLDKIAYTIAKDIIRRLKAR